MCVEKLSLEKERENSNGQHSTEEKGYKTAQNKPIRNKPDIEGLSSFDMDAQRGNITSS